MLRKGLKNRNELLMYRVQLVKNKYILNIDNIELYLQVIYKQTEAILAEYQLKSSCRS